VLKRRETLVVPVTALAFLTVAPDRTLLLVGEDTQFRVYELEANELLLDVELFPDQTIQGFHVQGSEVRDDGQRPRRILGWGGSEVAMLPVSAIEAALQYARDGGECKAVDMGVVRGKAPDRIYDGAINPFDSLSGSLATAHNELIEISWSGEKDEITMGNVISPSRPFLFSASLKYLSPESVLVAGGTIFGEILVWKCKPQDRAASCTLLHVFSGHEGSIFGVHLSEEITDEGGNSRRLLASCSDDRTIRIWDVVDSQSDADLESAEVQAPQARETGFGANTIPTGDKQADTHIALAMGHVSRIWHIRFPSPSAASGLDLGLLPLYSFGEDSTVQRWYLNLSTKQLTHQKTYTNHDGKHLWSAAIKRSANDSLMIATGGADGKISLIDEGVADASFDGAEATSPSITVVSQETLPLLETSSEAPKRRRSHDFLARYDFIANDTLLAATRSGKLLLGSFENDVVSWAEIAVDGAFRDDLRTCTVVARLGDSAALIGTLTKQLFLYQNGSLSAIGAAPAKVLKLICLAGSETEANVLLTVHESTVIRIYKVDLTSNSISSETTLRGIDSRFVLTSAALFHSLLVLGSRNGYLCIFRAQTTAYTLAAEVSPRSDDSITSILPLPGQNEDATKLSFIATSRDGNYRIYEICTFQQEIACLLRHETSPRFGPLIDRAWFVKRKLEQPSGLILSGFKNTNFIVWDESEREIIANISCGGPHREFAHAMDVMTGRFRFAFTKASKVFIYSQARRKCRTVKPGIHGREIRAIASTTISARQRSDGGPDPVHYLATGSEDTTIRIWEHSGDGSVRCAASVKMHETGLQSLKWCTTSSATYLLSSGGNEDFFIFRVRKLAADYAGIALFREATFTDRTVDGDLRITDFDVRVQATERGPVNAECRLIITMGFSNSSLKTYQYTQSEQRTRKNTSPSGKNNKHWDEGFELLASGMYTGACITQVRHLEENSVLTSSTDGHLAIWGTKGNELVLRRVIEVHQSSIKAMALVAQRDGRLFGRPWLAATTGDDNALGFTAFDASSGGDMRLDRKLVLRNAHAAAITGVVEIRGNKRRFATVSNDQRVKVWELGFRGVDGTHGRFAVRLLRDVPSGVADPGSVETYGSKLVIGGVGMEVWDMEVDR